MWWPDETTSAKEIAPRLNCQDWIKTSRNASVSINGKNGEILLRTWTIRQILPSCGELSKELTAEQAISFNGISFSTHGRERSYLLQRNLVLIVHAASHQVQQTVQQTVQHFKARQTFFFKRTSALLQLTTDIAMGFNQRKPPDRTVCVAVDLPDSM